jgi:hypothetical protein
MQAFLFVQCATYYAGMARQGEVVLNGEWGDCSGFYFQHKVCL